MQQIRKERLDLVEQAFPFGLDQQAKNTDDSEPEASRHSPTATLVHQHQIRFELDGQGDRFGLSSIHLSNECPAKKIVAQTVDGYPIRRSQFLGAGPPGGPGHFLMDDGGD